MDAVMLALARKYTADTASQFGAVKGANCQISGITPIAGGHRVTFSWKNNSNVEQTGMMDVKDGTDGAQGADGLGIKSLSVDASNHLIVTYNDDTTEDAGEIATVKGDTGEDGAPGVDGFSPEVTVKESTESKYILHIKTADDEYDTPNLKGGSSGGGSASAMSDLADVSLTGLSNGQILVYDSASAKWKNGAASADISELGDIEDVDLTNLKDGQVIKWNGAKWVNADSTNPTQFSAIPDAADYPQAVIQFIGADTATYKRGYFYRSTPSVSGGNVTYSWVQTDTQPSNRDYESLDNLPTIEGVEVSGDKELSDFGIQGQLQFSTLPAAALSSAGKIVQFSGTSTTDYKSGYWYQCAYDSESGSYKWVQKDVSSNTALETKVTQLQTNQGDMTDLEIGGVTNIVDALNSLNDKGLNTITYTEPTLTLTYLDGSTKTFDVGIILRATQIGELANVIDETIADGNILQYDSSINRYKPYAILTAMTNLLNESKAYTDETVQSSIQTTALVCDEKPSYDPDNDTVIYKQSGEVKTTTQTDTRFYYNDAEGDPYCTSWIDDIEYTYSVSESKFSDYLNKNTDVTSTYTEDAADKTKVPNISALDSLLSIVKEALGKKVNTTDIVDALTSQDATKVLSAKQGKVISDILGDKSDRFQYASMPVADSSSANRIVQYIGTTSGAYTNGSFYRCVEDTENSTWVWELIKYAADTDTALSATSENPVQNKAIKAALDAKQDSTLSAPVGEASTVEAALTAHETAIGQKQGETLSTAIEGATTVEGALTALSAKAVSVDGSTIVRDTETGELSAVTATDSTLGVVKPDGDSVTIDADGTLHSTAATPYDDTAITERVSDIEVVVPDTATESNKLATAGDIPDISGKQDKTLATALTIGGTSRTTVEAALGALNGVIPSTASASNKLITQTTANDYLTNLGWGAFSGNTIGESVVAGVNSLLTRVDVTRSYMLRGTYPAVGYWQAFISPPRTPSGHTWQALVQYERVGVDSHSSRGLYVVEFSYDSSADAGSQFTLIDESSVVKSSDLTSTVTSGSTAPITSGGVANYINTGVAGTTNTNTFTFDLPTLENGEAWEITVTAQTWNSNTGFVSKYIASRSGTGYRLTNCGGATTGFSTSISTTKVTFIFNNADNTIAYWRARYVKLI